MVALIVWKAGPFIKKAMLDRTARISTELSDAEGDRTGAEAERDRITASLADSDSESARIVEEARQTADRLTIDLEAKAHADAALLRERAAADLDATRRQAVADLTSEVSRLALGAAEQVVHGNLDDAAQQQLIEQYI
ncbi:MAG TPA: F0F1 ATP synthase subunit B, partial [Candidatus Saccharimonadia bacterium]|nr:F0F1 ATP synthase subunit B [Candidatus Saccharimonadia bacterium]